MKCYTIYEDRLPTEGIPLDKGGRTGLFGNICPVSSDPKAPIIQTGAIGSRSPLTNNRYNALVHHANFFPRTKEEFAILTAPKHDEVPKSILIYLVFDRNGASGDMETGDFFNGGDKITETSSVNEFKDYFEIYFYLTPGAKFVFIRQNAATYVVENVNGQPRYYQT